MQAKKKLIYRLAFWAGVALVAAATTAVSGLMLEDSRRDQFREDQQRAKQKRIEASRGYLAELAERVKKLPADATLVGAALYLLGTILVTMRLNVPLNRALAAVKPGSPEAIAVWIRYQSAWTVWNHVRTAASLAAAVAFIVALL